MRKAPTSWLASTRRFFSNRIANRGPRSTSRRLLVENLERREVFSTDFLSAFAIGNDTNMTVVTQVATDLAGNSYALGQFGGTVDFDPTAVHPSDADILTAQSTSDGFIAKYTPDNSLLWVRNISAGELKLDAAGNIYVAGSFSGSQQFGNTTLISAGASDGFVAKMNGAGAILWATRWGGVDNDFGTKIDLDANGNILAGGTRSHSSTSARLGVQAVKLNASGTLQWNKYVATAPGFGGFSLAAVNGGGVVLAGDFTGTVDFDPSSKTKYASVGAPDRYATYVLNLDASGNFKWVDTFQGTAGSPAASGTSGSRAVDIAVDPTGNIIVAGVFWGSVDFKSGSGTSILNSSSRVNYLTKLNSNGGFVWAKSFGAGASNTTSDSSTWGVAVDAFGSIYVVGYFTGTVDFDPTAGVINRTSTPNLFDMYVSCFSSSGNLNWIETIGGGYIVPRWIGIESDGTITVSGRFNETVDFDPSEDVHSLSSAGAAFQGFVVRWRRS